MVCQLFADGFGVLPAVVSVCEGLGPVAYGGGEGIPLLRGDDAHPLDGDRLGVECAARVDDHRDLPGGLRVGLLGPADASAELVQVVLDDGLAGAGGLQLDDGVLTWPEGPQVVRARVVQLLGAAAGEPQMAAQALPRAFGIVRAVFIAPDAPSVSACTASRSAVASGYSSARNAAAAWPGGLLGAVGQG